MFLNIRIFIVALIISSGITAQEKEKTEITTIETNQESVGPGKNVGSITLGPYFPIVFGDNFVNDGMKLKTGARLSLKFTALKDFYIGPYFSFFRTNVTNRELLGSYTNTTNYLFGAIVGYEKHIDKFDLSIGVGVGAATYRNVGFGDIFNDTATTVWLNPEVGYRFSTYLGVYIAPELRHDFMNIDVPEELKSTFKGVNYVNISLGIRFNLGTAYKYL